MKKDLGLGLASCLLIVFSLVVLSSIAPNLFPNYFLYFIVSILLFVLFSAIDFDVWSLFHKHLFILSLFFLLLPLIIGQITRGTIRWINLGPFTIQPSEIVKPFLLLFFSVYINASEIDVKKIIKTLILLSIPLILILLQPSLGVTILVLIGFIGIVLGSSFNKKLLLFLLLLTLTLFPLVFNFLAPYQKQRFVTFFSHGAGTRGASYQSIQSTIAVGSGNIFGKGLGQGVQTQLLFLPERHTDFIFASISEELGLFGAILVVLMLGFILYRIVKAVDNAINIQARCFIVGIFTILFTQSVIHIGMNLGMLPVTGIPLPFVSAGGSSLVSSMMMLGMVLGARKK